MPQASLAASFGATTSGMRCAGGGGGATRPQPHACRRRTAPRDPCFTADLEGGGLQRPYYRFVLEELPALRAGARAGRPMTSRSWGLFRLVVCEAFAVYLWTLCCAPGGGSSRSIRVARTQVCRVGAGGGTRGMVAAAGSHICLSPRWFCRCGQEKSRVEVRRGPHPGLGVSEVCPACGIPIQSGACWALS